MFTVQVLRFAIIFLFGSMMARMHPFCISWIKLENKFAQLIDFCDLIVGHFYWYITAMKTNDKNISTFFVSNEAGFANYVDMMLQCQFRKIYLVRP